MSSLGSLEFSAIDWGVDRKEAIFSHARRHQAVASTILSLLGERVSTNDMLT